MFCRKLWKLGICVSYLIVLMGLIGCTTITPVNTNITVTKSITPVSTIYTSSTSTQIASTMFPPVTACDVPPPAPVPWLNVTTYTEQTYQIEAKVGEEFAIGMYATVLPTQFDKSYDPNYVNLIADQVVYYQPSTTEGTEWLLFIATKEGNTNMVLSYPLEFSKIFKISIN